MRKDDLLANLVMVQTSADGAVDLYYFNGTADVAVDVFGWFGGEGDDSTAFHAMIPTRLADTRSGQGGRTGPIGQNASAAFAVTDKAGLPATGVKAVVVNLTAVDPTASGYLAMLPSAQAQPVSNVNFSAGTIVPNLVIVPVGEDGRIVVRNGPGVTHAVIDVVGWYG